MNESPPLKIGIMLTDKQTGNNLIQIGKLSADDIKVSLAQTGAVVNDWRVIKNINDPLNGILEFAVFQEKPGEYKYKIELKNLGVVDLSYTIKQEETGDPCKPHRYPMENLRVLNRDFEPFANEGKTYPNVMVVSLD